MSFLRIHQVRLSGEASRNGAFWPMPAFSLRQIPDSALLSPRVTIPAAMA